MSARVPFLVRLADVLERLVPGRRRDPELLATRAELAGMARRLDELVGAVEGLQVAAGLHFPVVECEPCFNCGGVLYREIVAPRAVSWSPEPHRYVRCLGCQNVGWYAAELPAEGDAS